MNTFERTRWASAGVATLLLLTVVGTAGLGGATHDDGFYDQRIISQADSARVDILVVPPAHGEIVQRPYLQTLPATDPAELHPYENTYLKAVLDSIADWEQGVEVFGPGWLANNLDIRVYVLGQDDLPMGAEGDIEIVVTTAEEFNPIWAGAATGAGGGETPCVVTNTLLGPTGEHRSYREMYGLSAHEVGHCLGLNHVGDGTNRDTFHPETDVMSYGPLSNTKCVSNLNVAGLELVFGPALGKTTEETVATLRVSAYKQIAC